MSSPMQDWLAKLDSQPQQMTAEEYDLTPPEICRAIEVVDGYVVFCEAPIPEHQRAGRRLANLLERHAATARSAGRLECVEVDVDIDLRLRDLPLLNRRPDVMVYRCRREFGERVHAMNALVVIEIVSPWSETKDTKDKPAEYAAAGIPHYWIARIDALGIQSISIHQLDRATSLYKHIASHFRDEGESFEVTVPFPMIVRWDELML